MNQKTVSVIIPVYNTAAYLRRCLDSVVAQSYPHLEVILVDDGSTDASPAICDGYAERDSRVKVIHKANGGVSSARNAGMDMATGDYIAFADSDDFCDANVYATMAEMLNSGADIAIIGLAQEAESGEFVPYCKPGKRLTFGRDEMIRHMLENKYYTCAAWDKMFRREAVEGIRWDESVSHNEDLLFLYEVMKGCERAEYTSEVGYYYCANEGSAVHSKFSKKKMTMIDVWDRILAENPDKSYIRNQYVRVNIMCAAQAAADEYDSIADIERLRGNIRRYLGRFLLSSMAAGYKLNAVLAAVSWKWLEKRVK